uniref:Uncharacterized protein n=1 Tax=Cucumis melo TaxID=3656 RepID=A0A9I9DMJ2_CUCME
MASQMASRVMEASNATSDSLKMASRVRGASNAISDSSEVRGALDVFMLHREFPYKKDVLVL